jgi:hypothetical protein
MMMMLIVARYAAIGKNLNTQSPVTYWIGNPNSYVWLSLGRPLSTASCPEYDTYRNGYTNFTEYPSKSPCTERLWVSGSPLTISK